jgi:hypothetical protein
MHLPRPVLFSIGKFSEFPFKLIKRPSPVAKYRLKSALARRTFRSVNAALLGWTPRVGAREGIRRVAGKAAAPPPSVPTTTDRPDSTPAPLADQAA